MSDNIVDFRQQKIKQLEAKLHAENIILVDLLEAHLDYLDTATIIANTMQELAALRRGSPDEVRCISS